MFNHRHYVPILKWKQGEYQALSRLTPRIQEGLTPLLELPDVSFDHESGSARETIEDHIGDFGRRLAAKWPRRCFVDLKYIPPATRLAGGRHYVDGVFELARNENCLAVPVVSLSSDPHFVASVAAVIRADRRGACLRLTMVDNFDQPALDNAIQALLRALSLSWEDVDLVVDMGTPNYSPASLHLRTMTTLIGLLPFLNRWRSFTIAGTSYPELVASVVSSDRPLALVARAEWSSYQQLVRTLLPSGGRIPTFGDYGVAHPALVEMDMRLIKPFAKLRYTTNDDWHLRRGTPVRTHGFGQYQQLCQELVRQPYFNGAAFSAGDQYIAECAAGGATGNLSTWVWVSMNQHMTKVVSDLATFHAL